MRPFLESTARTRTAMPISKITILTRKGREYRTCLVRVSMGTKARRISNVTKIRISQSRRSSISKSEGAT